MFNDTMEDIPRPSVSCEQSTEDLLKQLSTVVPEELHTCLQHVASDYQEKDYNVDHLNTLLTVLHKVLKDKTMEKQKVEGSKYTFPIFGRQAKVKVFPVVAAKTFGADAQILKKVDVEVCGSPADCDVVVVFCPVISRVGSDVDDAMRNIPAGAREKKVILLVMHHSRKDISSTETQLVHGHQNVIQDVHVVYHETVNGLIKCDRNEQAIKIMKEWCKTLTT